MVIYFVPVGLIVALLLLAIGGFYNLLQNISSIIFGILVAVFVIAGLILIGVSISRLVKKEGLLVFLSEFILGTSVIFLLPVVNHWLYIGQGTKTFKNAEYVLLGSFEKLDDKTAAIFISILLLLIILLPMIITVSKKIKSKIAYPLISLAIVCFVFLSGFNLSLKSEIMNSYDSFDWSLAEYEVTKDTPIIQKKLFDDVPLMTGKFAKGTKLYIEKTNTHFHNTTDNTVLVSDGKRIGRVYIENLRSLVTYGYFINSEAELYSIDYREQYYASIGKTLSLCEPGEIIEFIEKDTEITTIVQDIFIYEKHRYMKVKFSDGTEGCIDIDKITEIRE